MERLHLRMCAWSGIAFVALFAGALFLADFVPPPSPQESASEIAAMYANNRTAIMAASMISMSASGFYFLWSAMIGVLMLRMKGPSSVLAYSQIVAGASTFWAISIPCMIWVTNAFRPGRDPDLLFYMNDLAWLLLMGVFSGAFIQYLTFGLAILADKSSLFPRWMGYFSLWVALATLPATIMPFFTSGPFAWNGLLTFWVVATTFFLWIVVPFPRILWILRQ